MREKILWRCLGDRIFATVQDAVSQMGISRRDSQEICEGTIWRCRDMNWRHWGSIRERINTSKSSLPRLAELYRKFHLNS